MKLTMKSRVYSRVNWSGYKPKIGNKGLDKILEIFL